MFVVGIDPSLTATGVVSTSETGAPIIRDPIETKLRGAARLAFIVDAIGFGFDVTHIVVEGYSFGSPNRAHQMGELGGAIRLEAFRWGLPTLVVQPTTLKMFATGRGNAKKPQVLESVRELTGLQIKTHDQADALTLWCIGRHILGYPHPLRDVGGQHLRALEKIESADWV